MGWIAVDSEGNAWVFNKKPTRKLGKTFGWWQDVTRGGSVMVPEITPKLLNDAGVLYENNVPFHKRNMNWGDNPIQLKTMQYGKR